MGHVPRNVGHTSQPITQTIGAALSGVLWGVGFLVTPPSFYLLCLSAPGSRLFTAVMPMVAAGLILDDPTLQPVRRLVSLVGTVFGVVILGFFCCAFRMAAVAAASLPSWPPRLHGSHLLFGISSGYGV